MYNKLFVEFSEFISNIASNFSQNVDQLSTTGQGIYNYCDTFGCIFTMKKHNTAATVITTLTHNKSYHNDK